MQRLIAAVVASLLLAPLGARAADLVVWWDKGFYPAEDEAIREIMAAFEQKTGKQVELVQPVFNELPGNIVAALEAGQPPDFAFGVLLRDYIGQWALDNRLVDLSDAIGGFSDLFDPDVLSWGLWLNPSTGQKTLYGLPIGRTTYYLHVWKSLLKRAGFTLGDIPKEWEAFWSFWCDQVQPALRRALRRDDVWGVGLSMAPAGPDSQNGFFQFVAANQAEYIPPDGRLGIDDPEVRRKLVQVIDSYTAIYRKGCTPPEAVNWSSGDRNNKAFLAQTVVMTANETLSIPNALRRERPDDYFKNVATIEWPLGPHGEPFPIVGSVVPAMVFKGGSNVPMAKALVRFLVGEGWLAHYLDFSAERFLPAMPKLLDAPFWLDPGDPHRMAGVMQIASRPTYNYAQTSGNWRLDRVWQKHVWANAIHRVAAEGISPSRRSTRRSPGSSRYSRSDAHAATDRSRRRLPAPGAARGPGRRSRGVVGKDLLSPGERGGPRDRGRVQGAYRQAGRTRPARRERD
jgi:multiple sugar transport system substrate-binding protein